MSLRGLTLDIAEFTGQTLAKTYLWGMDLSGSMQGAGGVGGLLSISDHHAVTGAITARHYPTYDGNGNVSEYVNSSGEQLAHFEYDPFGNLTGLSEKSTGLAETFPYRFSTKPIDPVTELYYYGYRWYDSLTGRWPSRDPIGETGSHNLYGFAINAPIGLYDYLGMIVDIRHETKGAEDLQKLIKSDDELVNEIILKLKSSPTTFTFNSNQDFCSHVQARQMSVRNFENLKGKFGTMVRPPDAPSNPQNTNGGELNGLKSFSGGGWKFGCLDAIYSSIMMASIESSMLYMSEREKDRYLAGKYSPNRGNLDFRNRRDGRDFFADNPNDHIPGDWGYIMNNSDTYENDFEVWQSRHKSEPNLQAYNSSTGQNVLYLGGTIWGGWGGTEQNGVVIRHTLPEWATLVAGPGYKDPPELNTGKSKILPFVRFTQVGLMKISSP